MFRDSISVFSIGLLEVYLCAFNSSKIASLNRGSHTVAMKAVGDESFLAKYSFILPSAALAASIIDWDWVFDLSLPSLKASNRLIRRKYSGIVLLRVD